MLAFFPFLDMNSIAPMELDLVLAARRAVASMSAEWLTLKAATSMTTQLVYMCACIFELSLELSSIAPLERYACSWLAVWRGTLHLGHGNADRHQRLR